MAIIKAENARKDIPLVSIIAVCYNHENYVEETLDSILNQTYENIELIIIDSNSPDNSVEVIHNWIDRNRVECTFIKQMQPRTVCQNLNDGLKLISGEYFQGLSCDDVLKLDKIRNQVTIFEKILKENRDYAVVYGDIMYINEKSQPILYRNGLTFFERLGWTQYGDVPRGNIKKHLLNGSIIPAPSVLVRVDAVKNVDGFDESLSYEDWKLWLQITRNKGLFWGELDVVAKYRIIADSLSNRKNSTILIDQLKIYSWIHTLNWINKRVVEDKVADLLLATSIKGKLEILKTFNDYLSIRAILKRVRKMLGKKLHKCILFQVMNK